MVVVRTDLIEIDNQLNIFSGVCFIYLTKEIQSLRESEDY